jgi:pullulanase
MMRKYIVESVLLWATKYKIKGFRFDLMGLIDTVTLREIKDRLYELDKDMYIYGEGWDGMGGYNGAPGTKGGYTGNVYSDLYPTPDSPGLIGCFNDAGRNAIRGGNDQYWGAELKHPGWGYMQQGPEHCSADTRNNVANMLWGVHSGAGGNPLQHIAYASCHDNWTGFDQLYYTLGDTVNAPNLKTVLDASTAMHAFIMMSNSAAFILGGEELFRTKEIPAGLEEDILVSTYEDMYGHLCSHNSYNSPLVVNSFKWGNKISMERDGYTVDTTGYTAVFAEFIKLHAELPKYLPQNGQSFPFKTTSVGNEIYGISWAGAELGSSTPQTYNGCSGFQLDEYFVFLAGRQWGWVQFGDVPHSTKVFEFGPNEYDNINGTVNVGDINTNIGGAIVVYYRGKKM